ncbi:MazG nucleotide pyrophosphohydrolase domain-containing protein [Chlamydia avium]|uniref:MazG nucleotide pyrophosphohydrolase domain protein n=1 Tax=Chlamydia avium TaxID=1457141 RepID=A0ABP2X5Z0_9CHLA|nr:MazG nucleotide pyrophosphohydrolase domain-containing protein [Chlamydia avium]EPP37478.1 mazG nucleotide pyrophosphohydrolase domain protein [Chlamydia psittaci 10_743_SC13]EPP38067.1 mazG nucleotide pyrophosphohydrolase domain protein [Chlamydia avium]
MQRSYDFSKLIDLARKMVMDGVCPWTDRQDALSLIECILKECRELLEAIHQGYSDKEITLEAGDILMLVLVLCFKLEFLEISSVDEIVNEALSKIQRRAPHVFSCKTISYEEARQAWLMGKLQEKSEK